MKSTESSTDTAYAVARLGSKETERVFVKRANRTIEQLPNRLRSARGTREHTKCIVGCIPFCVCTNQLPDPKKCNQRIQSNSSTQPSLPQFSKSNKPASNYRVVVHVSNLLSEMWRIDLWIHRFIHSQKDFWITY